MPQGIVFSQLLVLLYTSVVISILENMLAADADGSTLITLVTIAKFMNRDLGKVSAWCDLCKMKLNANKTIRLG